LPISAPSLFCAALEVALNRYLRLEQAALEDCASLEGKVIGLAIADLGWTFFIEPIPSGVRVAGDFERAPDVLVTASGLKLLGLVFSIAARRREGLPQGITVDGDTELLTRFNAILRRVGFDPEEMIARLIGDSAAHRVVSGLKGLLGWGRTAAERLSLDTAEYLVEETGDLARAADVADWMDEVDQMRDTIERIEARLDILEQKAPR
jgi:ubiquinone biosynthesis protein UbiJ